LNDSPAPRAGVEFLFDSDVERLGFQAAGAQAPAYM